MSTWTSQKRWSEITREERQFCADLYNVIKDNPSMFVGILNSSCWTKECGRGGQLKRDCHWEVGVEVAFYRDAPESIGFAEEETASAHRKFDLALFSDDQFVIIEAKAQQGFSQKDLDQYLSDRCLISRKLADVDCFFVGLCSSQYIDSCRRKLPIEGAFDILLPWCTLAKRYSNSSFERADKVYGCKKTDLPVR